MTEIVCAQCGCRAKRRKGHVNRAIKLGMRLFCGRTCSWSARRKWKTQEQKRLEKRIYDKDYRSKNRERLRPIRAAYFQKVYSAQPEKFREIRRKRMPAHVEYCRRPEYKKKKHIYDQRRYAIEKFGPMWESHVLVMDIIDECRKRESSYESRLKNGTLNKALQRGRNGKTKRGYT